MLGGLQLIPIAVKTGAKILNMTNKTLYHLAHFYIHPFISQNLFFCCLGSTYIAFFKEHIALYSLSQSHCTCCSFALEHFSLSAF